MHTCCASDILGVNGNDIKFNQERKSAVILNYIRRRYRILISGFADIISKNKIFKIWVFTFSALVIFLTLMGGIFYFYLTGKHYVEQEKRYIERLEYVRSDIDGEYNAILRLASKLYLDEGINKLKEEGNITEYEFVDMFERFSAYKDLSGIKGDYFIWFADRDLCLSSASKYDKDLFSDVFVRQQKLFKPEQLEYFESEALENGYIVIGDGTPNRTMAHVIFMRKEGTPFIAIIVPFSNKIFYGAEETEEPHDVLVYDEDGENVFFTGEEGLDIDFGSESKTLLYAGEGNSKTVYAYVKSNSSLRYAVAMNYNDYIQSIRDMRRLFVLLILFEILLVIFLLVLFVRENYTPIKNIVSILPHNSEKKNEYAFIRDGINSLLNKYQDKEDRIEKQKKQLEYLYLEKIITSEDAESNNRYIEYMKDIHFLSDCFCVILFYVYDDGVLKTADEGSRRSHLTEFVLRNITEELASKHNLGYLVEVSGMYCCLVNYSPDRCGKHPDATEIASQTVEFLRENFEFGIKAFVGECVYGIDNIAKSYNEVVFGLEKKIYDNDSKVVEIGCNECYENEDGKVFSDILEYIDKGDDTNAVNAFMQLVDRVKADDIFERSRDYIINDFLFALLEILQNANRETDGLYLRDVHMLLKTIHKNKGIIAENSIKDIVVKLCKYNYNKLHGAEKNLYVRMKKYIDERCYDYELNSAVVADEFNVSLNYFLRFFKNNSGISFIEYLHTLRIKRAMELIDNSNAKIEEIFTSCGYSSYDTFSRAFKKNTGMRPTDYRNRIR